MSSTAAEPIYADWKAPAGDGEMLVWPTPAEMVAQTRENQKRLSSCELVRVQNTPLPELRRATRATIGHNGDDRPLIATGHQSELYHPGVWVKDVLLDVAAKTLDGIACHVAVDTDHPKHLHVRWPGQSLPITDDPAIATASWSGLLKPPSAAHVDQIEATARSEFSYEPMLFAYLDALKRRLSGATTLSSLISDAQRDVDEQLGLAHRTTMISPMLWSSGFLAFAHHILARPERFASSYNAALAEYRVRTGTRSNMRPMPDLFVHSQSIETPFWLDNLADGTRTRPSVFPAPDGRWLLELVGGEEFIFDPALDAFEASRRLGEFLDRTNHRLAPRALTLTLFLRLLVADQFVHGIGGGRYDQVTDRIIATHFNLAPPRFCVTTGTLFFPGAIGRDRVCMPCLLHEGHRLKHAVLGERKRELISAIAAHPRGSSARSSLFLDMQRERRAAVSESPEVERWVQKLSEASTRAQEDKVIFDRELFYAVQSRERLESMIEKYRGAFTS